MSTQPRGQLCPVTEHSSGQAPAGRPHGRQPGVPHSLQGGSGASPAAEGLQVPPSPGQEVLPHGLCPQWGRRTRVGVLSTLGSSPRYRGASLPLTSPTPSSAGSHFLHCPGRSPAQILKRPDLRASPKASPLFVRS